MRSGEKSQLKKFSGRLQSFYSNWRTHQSRQWMGAKLIVFSAPPESRVGNDRDLDSLKFFEWLFGEWLYDAYIVLSSTEIYAVCSDGDGLYDAKFLSSFADEAKKIEVGFTVKDKGSGRTLSEALVKMANGLRRPNPSPGVKKEEKVAVGFIGEKAPENELAKWMEWKDVTDAFCRVKDGDFYGLSIQLALESRD